MRVGGQSGDGGDVRVRGQSGDGGDVRVGGAPLLALSGFPPDTHQAQLRALRCLRPFAPGREARGGVWRHV